MKRKGRLLLILFCFFSFFYEGRVFGLGESFSGGYKYDVNGRLTYFESTEGYVYYEYDKNGNLISKRISFGGLDSPVSGEVRTSELSIKGWYMDKKGVTSIKVYLDNVYKGLATYGDSREDIYQKYPKFGNHNAGFHFDTVLPQKTNNVYEIKVVIINASGEETIFTRTIIFNSSDRIGYVDYPAEEQTVPYYSKYSSTIPANQMQIIGWYLDMVPLRRISVYVDNLLVDSTYKMMPRTDVYNAYPQYNNRNAGFSITIPTPPAVLNKTITHQLKLVFENTDGQQKTMVRNFKVVSSNATVISDPPNPGDGK